MKSQNIRKYIQRLIPVLPLGAIVGASFLHLKPFAAQALVAAAIIWFQVVIIFEVFLFGK